MESSRQTSKSKKSTIFEVYLCFRFCREALLLLLSDWHAVRSLLFSGCKNRRDHLSVSSRLEEGESPANLLPEDETILSTQSGELEIVCRGRVVRTRFRKCKSYDKILGFKNLRGKGPFPRCLNAKHWAVGHPIIAQATIGFPSADRWYPSADRWYPSADHWYPSAAFYRGEFKIFQELQNVEF